MRTLLFLFISISFLCKGQISQWKMLVNDNDISHYLVLNSNISNQWVTPEYNDSLWSLGRGGFGSGDFDDSTSIAASPSIFIRHHFMIHDSSTIQQALLHIDYDDGFVAYLNGKEICRRNMGTIVHPNYAAFATTSHEALLKGNGIPEAFKLSPENLKNDTNLLCIQIHNVSHTSPDVTARFWINVELMNDTNTYRPIPSWLEPETELIESNLPLILINTEGIKIQDAYRIKGSMEIIHDRTQPRNTKFDPANEYKGNINIEIRGTSSSNYPKKQYSIETQNEWGANNNVSIFDFPKENDWILYAPYSDKSLLRNVLAYKISEEMGQYAPRTQLCEVYLNNQYQGVYVFTEKIKRDEGRVDISKLKKTDLTGNQVTGGYILEVDRNDISSYTWQSPYAPLGGSTQDINIVCKYPDFDDIQLQQINYINNWFTAFEDNLFSSSFDDPKTGYSRFINTASFIDFFLVQEISKNVDGYRLSSYLHKNRSDKDSLLHAGPVWDFNLGFGNADYCLGGHHDGWAYNFNDICAHHLNQVPFWWSKLLEDENYRNQIKCRWNELRTSTLRTSKINEWIDQQSKILQEAQERNFKKWPVLSTYVTPNNFVGNTYENEIEYFRNWINNRLEWMDQNMFGTCNIPIQGIEVGSLNASAYPTSFQNELTLRVLTNSESKLQLKIWDQVGSLILQENLGSFDIGNHEFSLSKYTHQWAQGIYLIQVINELDVATTLRVIKN